MSSFDNVCNFFGNNLQTDANFQYSNSLAEQTIRDYSPSTSSRVNTPLVAKKDGKMYPQNPNNQYISCFPDGFESCLGYRSTTHRFRTCPRKDNKALRDIFWQELWAHIPSYRKKPSPPSIPTNSSPSTFVMKPSSSLKLSSVLQISTITPRFNINSINCFSNSTKRARFMKRFARISNISSSNRKPMPIPINNSFTCTFFNLD